MVVGKRHSSIKKEDGGSEERHPVPKNHSSGSLFGMNLHHRDKERKKDGEISGKEEVHKESHRESKRQNHGNDDMRRTSSFKDVFDAVTHFHLPTSKSAPKLFDQEQSKLYELARQPGFHWDISQFEVIKQIGSGTFGRVLLCKHSESRELVVLKTLDKRHIIKTGQRDHVLEEKEALRMLSQHDCPFTVHAIASFQDTRTLYFVMEYLPGGELFAHLSAARHHRFTEKRARFYIGELILALKYMHEKEHIVYRDIKPENMLLDQAGHLKIIDFGFAKHLGDEERTFTFCGTPDYLAPEVIKGEGYNKEADLWSLGVLIYELIVGHAPFVTYNPTTSKVNYQAILDGNFALPSHLSPQAKDLIIRLLQTDHRRRLGSRHGIKDVMDHSWFRGLDWEALARRELKPPKRHHFKKGMVNIQAKAPSPRPSDNMDDIDPELFRGFDFVVGSSDDDEDEDCLAPPEDSEEGRQLMSVAGPVASEPPTPHGSGDEADGVPRPKFFV